ncbi:MAG: 4Fe-4S dicluster domain-containing protein, partial [Planctomycetota bacterium]
DQVPNLGIDQLRDGPDHEHSILEFSVPLPHAFCGEPEELEQRRNFSWMQILVMESEHSERPRYFPRPCMQCDNPPCTAVCPVGATSLNLDGIVSQIYDRCIGCRYCTNNCPYTAKYFNWTVPVWPEEMRRGLNPDVSVRPKGVVEKCTFCHHRLQRIREQAKAEGRAIRDGEFVPACLEVCPTKAIRFGDLNDENSGVSHAVSSSRAFKELEDLGTEPKVYYLREDF